MTEKIKINMLSKADSVDGQGVGSAYIEQVRLVKESPLLLVSVNGKPNKKSDIIHIHSVHPQYYFKMNKRRVSVCYVHFLPETLDGSIKLPKPIFWFFKKYIIKMYKKADYIVVVNPVFIEPLKKYGIKEERIKYIPNYVDQSTVHELSLDEKKNLKKKYGLEGDDFIVVGVGQVQTRKGVLDFVETAKKNPNIKFIWCGGFSFKQITSGYKELKEVMDNPPSNVKFLGIIPRENMNEIYNISNLLFLPSYNELFPMCILEAIQIDLPILLRDVDLYEPILFDKYQKGTNNDDFSNIINKLKEDDSFYQEAKEKSKYLKEFYSKESILKIWEEFYLSIYNKKKGIKK
ncbi:glycosyltransferase [Acholeplasma sp. OttesenSCG-928-E16]|nr:glycosyltransferase [Acholeplasma sp. OttesenSCG-928-E16]